MRVENKISQSFQKETLRNFQTWEARDRCAGAGSAFGNYTSPQVENLSRQWELSLLIQKSGFSRDQNLMYFVKKIDQSIE